MLLVRSGCTCSIEGVNVVFANQLSISEPLETWITPDELSGAILSVPMVPICFTFLQSLVDIINGVIMSSTFLFGHSLKAQILR